MEMKNFIVHLNTNTNKQKGFAVVTANSIVQAKEIAIQHLCVSEVGSVEELTSVLPLSDTPKYHYWIRQ